MNVMLSSGNRDLVPCAMALSTRSMAEAWKPEVARPTRRKYPEMKQHVLWQTQIEPRIGGKRPQCSEEIGGH